MQDDTKHTILEAIKVTKQGKKRAFDPTVELHINLRLNPSKQDEQIRFTTILPKGTGVSKKVAVMSSTKAPNADLEIKESDLSKIEKGDIRPGRDFDVLVADPASMPKLAKVARILGPAGVMPNPKTGTVTEDVEKAVEQFKKGKVEVRMEQNAPIIHTILGKLSFSDEDLADNYSEVITSIKQHKPTKAKPDFIKSAFLTTTMGPSVQLEV